MSISGSVRKVTSPSQDNIETNRPTRAPKVNLESPIKVTIMSLNCVRKLEYQERIHASMGRTCRKTSIWDSNPGFSFCKATAQHYYHFWKWFSSLDQIFKNILNSAWKRYLQLRNIYEVSHIPQNVEEVEKLRWIKSKLDKEDSEMLVMEGTRLYCLYGSFCWRYHKCHVSITADWSRGALLSQTIQK